MKKNMLKAMVLLAVLAFAATAFAAAVIVNSTTSIGGLSFSPSNNVTVAVNSTTAAYTVESLHKSGNRVFGTDSVASVIYWHDQAIDANNAPSFATEFGTITAATTTGTHGTPDFSAGGWTSM